MKAVLKCVWFIESCTINTLWTDEPYLGHFRLLTSSYFENSLQTYLLILAGPFLKISVDKVVGGSRTCLIYTLVKRREKASEQRFLNYKWVRTLMNADSGRPINMAPCCD